MVLGLGPVLPPDDGEAGTETASADPTEVEVNQTVASEDHNGWETANTLSQIDTGLAAFFDALQVRLNDGVLNAPFPLIGDSLASETLGQFASAVATAIGDSGGTPRSSSTRRTAASR